ncbi:MAG: NAD(P)H-hydrate epimerase [Tissierellia bacterium]|nr:NAD(P)H-hydrate epimerase [Tissierellia bacterium]
MMAISCNEMKSMDRYAIDSIGIPSIILMENAALEVVANVDLDSSNSFTIICGIGNNGGDGLAIARHLILKEKKVELFIIGRLDKGTADFHVNLNILNNMGINYVHIADYETLNDLKISVGSSDLTIDSIFGIGLTRNVGGLFYQTIKIINEYSRDILSVDIPSGLHGDTGQVLGISIKAKKTVTFHRIKKGMVDNEGYTGKIIVGDIGIPQKVTEIILGQS